MEGNSIVAPFVMKTYQMVNDPMTDNLITWGKANNSFIVVDPLDFPQRILPAYFKHNNFSSFVRQLNTYGFKKVDPDKWEFANEWFLRGQKHLLKNIVRKKHHRSSYTLQAKHEIDDAEEDIFAEIARLKQEQKGLEEEIRGMNKRLEATERRPQQMMALLCKVVEDPEILPRMMIEKERAKRLCEKKKRLMISTTSSSSGVAVSSCVKSEEEDDWGTVGVISSPEVWQYDAVPRCFDQASVAGMSTLTTSFAQAEPVSLYRDGGRFGFFSEVAGDLEDSSPPYPFSLLGGGF